MIFLARGSYSSHFCLDQALELIRILRPPYVFFTGMSHLWDHESGNAHLARLVEEDTSLSGLSLRLAHDGLRLSFH